jgi:hypothetical protein
VGGVLEGRPVVLRPQHSPEWGGLARRRRGRN